MKRNVTFAGTCWSSGGVWSADQLGKPHAVGAQTSLQMRAPPSFDATATVMTEITCSIIYMCTNIMHLHVCELLCKSPQCDMRYDALFPRMEIRSNRLPGCRAESGCTSVRAPPTHLNILNFCLKIWHYKWKPTPTQRQKLLLLTY